MAATTILTYGELLQWQEDRKRQGSGDAGDDIGGGEEASQRFQNLSVKCLETYLASDEFLQVFGMPREAFDALPGWKRARAKKEAGLY